jgi:hypothetical protein
MPLKKDLPSDWETWTPTEQESYLALPPSATEKAGSYRSPHYQSDPNLLVHTRSNSRTLPTGERGRLIENVQSDWHQEARKKGYKQGLTAKQENYQTWGTREHGMTPEEIQRTFNTDDPRFVAYRQQQDDLFKELQAVPDAPFKDSWPALGLKQEVLDAVERGDDWIGITPASILNTRGEAISETFQDQRLPLTLEKILQPFGGGRVERGAVSAGTSGSPYRYRHPETNEIGAVPGAIREPNPDSQATIEAFIARLTPQMREEIKKKGLPLLMAMLAAQGLTPVASHEVDTPATPVRR